MIFKNCRRLVGIVIIRICFYNLAVVVKGKVKFFLFVVNTGKIGIGKEIVRKNLYGLIPVFGSFCIFALVAVIGSNIKIKIITRTNIIIIDDTGEEPVLFITFLIFIFIALWCNRF